MNKARHPLLFESCERAAASPAAQAAGSAFRMRPTSSCAPRRTPRAKNSRASAICRTARSSAATVFSQFVYLRPGGRGEVDFTQQHRRMARMTFEIDQHREIPPQVVRGHPERFEHQTEYDIYKFSIAFQHFSAHIFSFLQTCLVRKKKRGQTCCSTVEVLDDP